MQINEQLISEAFMFQLDAIASNLNDQLIHLLGEDADWHPTDRMPKAMTIRIKSERLKRLTESLWAIREECNGALHWEDGRNEEG